MHVARKYTLLALPISIRNHCGRPTVIYEGLACHSSIKLLSSYWKKREVMLLVIDRVGGRNSEQFVIRNTCSQFGTKDYKGGPVTNGIT